MLARSFFIDSSSKLLVSRTGIKNLVKFDFGLNQITYYASNFEEVDGTYWFRVVRASVRLLKAVDARVLKFHIWIPHGKIFDTHFFLVRVIPL